MALELISTSKRSPNSDTPQGNTELPGMRVVPSEHTPEQSIMDRTWAPELNGLECVLCEAERMQPFVDAVVTKSKHYFCEHCAVLLHQTIQHNGPWASARVGESGGAYNSGGHHVFDSFMDSFWYLDQLGMASKFNTKAYCRQTLVGRNYGLLNTATFVHRPDYYSALLWHQLMGKGVLAVNAGDSPHLHSYAHYSKGRVRIAQGLVHTGKGFLLLVL
ncbi:hypothetical protein SO802_016694 [Lithocarpus litseifolius]|uniref:Uncharacterized protein n=1 Tax=Lithocarpus litseifolius TaxID=425828 RepID=A0AAW2CX74_9ROSI